MLTIYNSNSAASNRPHVISVGEPAVLTTVSGQSLALFDADGRDDANIALAPEDVATLTSLVSRYDQLLVEVDALNLRIEEILKAESPVASKS